MSDFYMPKPTPGYAFTTTEGINDAPAPSCIKALVERVNVVATWLAGANEQQEATRDRVLGSIGKAQASSPTNSPADAPANGDLALLVQAIDRIDREVDRAMRLVDDFRGL